MSISGAVFFYRFRMKNAVQTLFLASSWWRILAKCFFTLRHGDECWPNAFSRFVTVTNADQTLFHISSWWRLLTKRFFTLRHRDDCWPNAFSHFVMMTIADQTLFLASSPWRLLSNHFFLHLPQGAMLASVASRRKAMSCWTWFSICIFFTDSELNSEWQPFFCSCRTDAAVKRRENFWRKFSLE